MNPIQKHIKKADGILNHLVGKVMKETKGTANPTAVRSILLKILQEDSPQTLEGKALNDYERVSLL